MTVPTDWIKKAEGTTSTFTPGYVGASIIEFSSVALQSGGGMESGIGEDVTGTHDYVDGKATAKQGGSRKVTYKPFTIECLFSPTQRAELKAAMGEIGRGTYENTFVDGTKESNASVDLIDYDPASDTTTASGMIKTTLTFQPSGYADWVDTPAT